VEATGDNSTDLIMKNTTKSALLGEAVSVLKRGEFSDYLPAAIKYGVPLSAISRRVREITSL